MPIMRTQSQVSHPRVLKRGTYIKLTAVQQAQIAKYAVANGNKATIRRYTKEFSTEIKLVHGKRNTLQK